MPPSQGLPPSQAATNDFGISPQSSAAPLIPESERQQADQGAVDGGDPTTDKRKLFGFGKKKGEGNDADVKTPAPEGGSVLPDPQAAAPAVQSESSLKRPLDLKAPPQPIAISPSRHPYPSMMAASPSRIRSNSPRLHSPASSEIFERSVQEPATLSTLQNEIEPKAHMATHVMTEDQIPPALEASVQVITSEELNPDEVEIVTSTVHQPASLPVLEGSASHADLSSIGSSAAWRHDRFDSSEPSPAIHHSGLFPPTTSMGDEGASNYAQLDPNDVRRLSFISFADVVQGEHQQQAAASELGGGGRDGMHPGSFPHDRAASPLRSPGSPGSSAGVTTPPLLTPSMHAEQSPSRGSLGMGSPPTQHGELQIETMRQAVRKTASGDLGGSRSAGLSPVNSEEHPWTRSRTNT